MKMGYWVTVIIVLVVGYWIGKTYPNLLSRVAMPAG